MTFSEYKWGPEEGLNSAGDPERVQMGVQRGPDWEEGGGGGSMYCTEPCVCLNLHGLMNQITLQNLMFLRERLMEDFVQEI